MDVEQEAKGAVEMNLSYEELIGAWKYLKAEEQKAKWYAVLVKYRFKITLAVLMSLIEHLEGKYRNMPISPTWYKGDSSRDN